jgi:hypothetical protein
MKYFIDNVISLMKAYTNDDVNSEMKEQDAAPSGGGSTGGGGSAVPTVPIWADVVGGPARGPANMLGKDGEVWSSDVKRGVANQVW